jgi:hypothetical protein
MWDPLKRRRILSRIGDLICFVGGAVLLSDGIATLVANPAHRGLAGFEPVAVPETIMWGVGLIVLGVVRVLWRKEAKHED